MMVAAEGHTRKRPFQPSISFYFNRDASTPESRTAKAPTSTALPPDVQSNLLSAGMRARKAVNEGYKTHKTIPVDSVPFPSTAPTITISRESSYNSRELQPFCGLHKVGGWAEQETAWAPPSSAPAAMSAREYEDELPPLSASQSTIRSTQQSCLSAAQPEGGAKTKKRSFEEEIEDDMDAIFDEELMSESQAQRPIARPRNQRRPPQAQPTVVWDNEDFEDAAFLEPPEDMETGV